MRKEDVLKEIRRYRLSISGHCPLQKHLDYQVQTLADFLSFRKCEGLFVLERASFLDSPKEYYHNLTCITEDVVIDVLRVSPSYGQSEIIVFNPLNHAFFRQGRKQPSLPPMDRREIRKKGPPTYVDVTQAGLFLFKGFSPKWIEGRGTQTSVALHTFIEFTGRVWRYQDNDWVRCEVLSVEEILNREMR